MKSVTVNGYGTIGEKVASAVAKQPDMRVLSVAKVSRDYMAKKAVKNGFTIHFADEKEYVDAVTSGDIVVDATNSGSENKKNIYSKREGLHIIFQGGERAKDIGVCYNSYFSYDKALGQRYIKVVSCNTTAICRIWKALRHVGDVKWLLAYLARRAADPHQLKGGLVNDVVVSAKSHHAEDVIAVDPRLQGKLIVRVKKVPVSLMHTHDYIADYTSPPSKEKLLDLFHEDPRVVVLHGEPSHNQIFRASDYSPIPHLVLLADTLEVVDSRVLITAFVDQQQIVIPENIDAIRASLGLVGSSQQSCFTTDKALEIDKLKQELEYCFS